MEGPFSCNSAGRHGERRSWSWNPRWLWGQQVTGGEDKPEKAPQILHEWKVTFLGWIWFSDPWSPTLPAQGGLCGHKPQASGHSHPRSHIMAPLGSCHSLNVQVEMQPSRSPRASSVLSHSDFAFILPLICNKMQPGRKNRFNFFSSNSAGGH